MNLGGGTVSGHVSLASDEWPTQPKTITTTVLRDDVVVAQGRGGDFRFELDRSGSYLLRISALNYEPTHVRVTANRD